MDLIELEAIVREWHARQPKNTLNVVVKIELQGNEATVSAGPSGLTLNELFLKGQEVARKSGKSTSQFVRVWNGIRYYNHQNTTSEWGDMHVSKFLENYTFQDLMRFTNVGKKSLDTLNELLVQNGFEHLRKF